jgi:DNA-binding NarL/FixJ family response regulator
MEVVGEAGDGVAALAQVETARPDLVVMDLSMPRLNGLEATEQLRGRIPSARVLMLSVHEDATYLRRALEAGVASYILKRSAAETLISALRAVASGKVYLDPTLDSPFVDRLMCGNGRAKREVIALSEREGGVLRLIARGYSSKEIAARLTLSVKAVETYKALSSETFFRLCSRAPRTSVSW